ncbi:hypothetical protein LTR29_008329 [Friedmanniomyces endolithicus]|nr:hypothetical protein LTR29_008329 [Friedmanniomyces endolithicus]
MKLLYPTSLSLDPKLLEGFNASIHSYDVKEPIPEDLTDAEGLITWCNSPSNLKDAASRCKKLKWIQSLAAGPNDVLNAGFDPKTVTITTGSGLHDQTVAEHTLGMLLTAARKFHLMRDSQTQGKWPGNLGGPQPDKAPGTFTTLHEARILVWGFGNIAKTLTLYLRALGAEVKGVARHAGETDALVMILPGSDSTKHALNAERLKVLPKHAWVVNVGRGTCIDEAALNSALDEGAIGGAALDVFEKEPLDESSPLYKQKNVILSPHAAGGRPRGAEGLIAENLRRFLAGQELKNVL